MSKQEIAYKLHKLGWDYRTLGKYFRVSRTTIGNWIKQYMALFLMIMLLGCSEVSTRPTPTVTLDVYYPVGIPVQTNGKTLEGQRITLTFSAPPRNLEIHRNVENTYLPLLYEIQGSVVVVPGPFSIEKGKGLILRVSWLTGEQIILFTLIHV